MSAYSRGKEPVCPVKLPGCLGKIKDRNAQMCGSCRHVSRRVAAPEPEVPVDKILADRKQRQEKVDSKAIKKKYDDALKTIDGLEKLLTVREALREPSDTYIIEPKQISGTSEGVAVAVASDWHCEEKVGKEVDGLNVYSLEIAKARAIAFFRSVLNLTNLLGARIHIDTIVLALLGDFITNDIHDELVEICALLPIPALLFAKDLLVAGIEFLLRESPYKLIIPCHSGNHARTTKTTHVSTENGHSLEYLLYVFLEDHFRAHDRVQFIIPDAYHSYVQVYDQTIRFHHGHNIKFGGGIGGLTIPANKAIDKWNTARHADLDVFGHFHQRLDGENFLCNGSLIGFNAFAVAIKAPYQKPSQNLFLIDKKRGRTARWPIYV